MKALAAANPGLVRLLRRCPARSWEGREIMGIEIAENVGATDDGRPSMVMVGTHHAREWPANEATLEWGYRPDQRLQVRQRPASPGSSRARAHYLVPVVNVDGFDVTIQSEGLHPRRQLRGSAGLGRARAASGYQARRPAPTSARTAGPTTA